MFYTPEAFESRDFDVQERVLSQSVIVWDYLRQIALPRMAQLGLYHENYPISRSIFEPLATAFALTAWLLLAVLFMIAVRQRYYLIVFAVAWFVGGHLLESSTLALELYFEHRSYLPSFAVWFASAIGAYYLCLKLFVLAKRRLVIGLLLAYVGVLLSQSFYLVKLWGNPVRLAYLYTVERPDSLRAREMMIYLYQVHGEMSSVKTEIARMGGDFPQNLTVRLLQLEYACLYPDLLDYRFNDELLGLATRESISIGVVGSISDLFDRLKGGKTCDGYSIEQLIELADLVIQHPKYVSNRDNILALRSEIKLHQGDIFAALSDMQSVAKPNYRMSIRVVQLLATLGRKQEAIQRLDGITGNSSFALQVKAHEKFLSKLAVELSNLESER
ncbi:hypothetical protein [uncultured Pseudoteredinibacter sp.]|uniref:hypothetical protein n=1 Tax=uncultured Pseudoteredinibacter sp. TaxID=1641701 RepID=UPI0026368FE9|nr:hypothetical protein [uncultured Pseudoteredinibacter sp.]